MPQHRALCDVAQKKKLRSKELHVDGYVIHPKVML